MKRTLIPILIFSMLIPIFVYDAEAVDQVSSGKIEISSDWEGPPTINDTDGLVNFNLTGTGAMLNSSIGKVISIMVFNEDLNTWASFDENWLFNISIIRISDVWITSVKVERLTEGRRNVTFLVENSTRRDEIVVDITVEIMNRPPENPEYMSSDPLPSENIFVGDEIIFMTSPVFDQDNDELVYNWDFGDGAKAEGMNVSHAYSKKGFKTVQMWVSDGYFESEKCSMRMEILDIPYEYHYEMWDSDGDGFKDIHDAFPYDPAASEDSDGDGYPDYWNFGMDEDDSTSDLRIDHYPRDPDRNGYERSFLERKGLYLIIVLIVAMAIIVIVSLMVMALIKQNGRS